MGGVESGEGQAVKELGWRWEESLFRGRWLLQDTNIDRRFIDTLLDVFGIWLDT